MTLLPSWRTLLCLPLVLLVLGLPALAGPEAPKEEPELEAEVAADLDRILASGLTDQDLTWFERKAILAHGDMQLVLDRIAKVYAEKSEASTKAQMVARWHASRLLMMRGDLREALTLAKLVSKAHNTPTVKLHEAWLLDATGRTRDALKLYKAQADRIDDVALETKLRLRIALMGPNGNAKVEKTLNEFASAKGRDPDIRNRAAVVLALKGHPKSAIQLFVVQGEGSTRFRLEARRADWALAAKQYDKAQEFAWAAVKASTVVRDKRYALTLLVEAYREAGALDKLIEKFASDEDLDEPSRQTWIDLLRETGRFEEALELFRRSAEGRFTIEMRRELLEICRESGREDVLVEAYRELIKNEPTILEWREGLCRYYLERGKSKDAQDVWRTFLETPEGQPWLLAAADSLMGLGLDELAIQAAETAIKSGRNGLRALLFLHGLHKARGRMDEAEAQLQRMDDAAPDDAVERAELGEAYERMGRKERAVDVLEKLRKSRGEGRSGEDLEMRLAWLHSEVGNEETALERWRELWLRVESVPRRRYVEDRMMAVASRLGSLADIAIELEEKLAAGTATARDSGLLVRLYTKANDAISATEIIEEYMKRAGGDPVKALVEKARVFLSCTDYHNYEKTVRTLIETDPEGRGDYLRQLAMSQLERGKPDEAREVLLRLKEEEKGSDSAEFEAGVLALAGLRDEAIQAYNRGLATYPDRIESHLLLANLMREVGKQAQAIGKFQYLAANADKDDLFTIAIDGLLNMEAPAGVVRWARRLTLERLASRHDKMYLYQLLSDLSEEANERDRQLSALQSALPISGERRASLLRELMDLSKSGRGNRVIFVNGQPQRMGGDAAEKHLMFGRRLIGLRELAPPQVYLDLGGAFLQNEEVTNAARTFALASDVPDYAAFQRQVAGAFENAGYPKQALRTFERLLTSMPGNVPLMIKVAELHEQLGRDDRAAELHRAALDLLLLRRPRTTFAKEEEEEANPYAWFYARNVDEFDQYYSRAAMGVLTTGDEDGGTSAMLSAAAKDIALDLARAKEELAGLPEVDAKNDKEEEAEKAKRSLRAFPRLQARARWLRRMAFASATPAAADRVDLQLVAAFPQDEKLLEKLVKERVTWGYVHAARDLLDKAERPAEDVDALRYLVGGSQVEDGGFVDVKEGARLFLALIADGRAEDARSLLRRLDFTKLEKEDLAVMPVLLSTAVQLEDGSSALSIARTWIRTLIKGDKQGRASWTVRPVLGRIRTLMPKEKYRDLVQYIVGMVLDDIEKAGGWLSLIPELQRQFEEPLLDEQQIDDLLEKLDGNRWYWVGSFFALVPPKRHSAVLRAVLPKVPPSRRMQFLLQLIQQFDDELLSSFAEMLVESFVASLEHVDRNERFSFYVFNNLATGDRNVQTRYDIANAAVEKGVDSKLVIAARCVLAKKLELEDAVEQAVAVYREVRKTQPNDFQGSMARNLVTQNFLPDEIDAFLADLDEEAKKGGDALEILGRRLDLLARLRDVERKLQAHRDAAKAHPEEIDILQRLETQLRRHGRLDEAITVLEKMIAAKPDDKALKRRLFATWQRLGHSIRALEVKREMESEEEAGPPKPEAKKEKKSKSWVNVTDLKKAVDNKDYDEARTVLRRLWRTYPKEGQRFFPGFFGGNRKLNWPVTRKADAAANARRRRGGLTAFVEPPPKPIEARSAFEVVAELPFGEAELRRQVRTWTGPQLSRGGDVVRGIAHGMIHRLGRETAARVLEGALQRGTAGRLEHALLLTMLEEDPEGVIEDPAALLQDLAQTTNAQDSAQIRRLARIQAALGRPENAARLYRWCAARAGESNPMMGRVIYVSGRPGMAGNELLEEVGEVLEGDLKVETVEAILELSRPQQQTWQGPTWRDGYDTLVLHTWLKVVGPDEALVRCREVIDELGDLEQGLRRNAAKLAAGMLAKAGEHERALRCLEVAICKHEPVGEVQFWQQRMFTQFGYMSADDIRRLFPADTEGWKDAGGWFEAAADALLGWQEAERSGGSASFQALAILALRLEEAGKSDKAQELLEHLRKEAKDSPGSQLWIIDVARELEQEDVAYQLERGLLESGKLGTGRIQEVLERVGEREGADVALDLGEVLTKTTVRKQLMDTLVKIAKAQDDEARTRRIEALAKEAEEARKALEPKKPK